MSDLLNEIMQDMQADRMQQLWSKYGKWVIYTAVSIVIVTAVMVYWNHHQRNQSMRATALYFEAVTALSQGDGKTALDALNKMSLPSKSSYTSLVLLKKAEAQQLLKQDKEARATLAELSKRNDAYGDTGKILLKSNTADTKTATLQYSLKEWAAWQQVEKGDNVKAAEQFTLLAKMENVPGTIRERALAMSTYLKSNAGN